jgi:hypothetical protein
MMENVEEKYLPAGEVLLERTGIFLIYANSEPQPNAKYSCAASVAVAR